MARQQAARLYTEIVGSPQRTTIRKLQMENFFERCGLVKRWLCLTADLPEGNFSYFFETGFNASLAERIENIIQRNGEQLSRFNFGNDHPKDMNFLRYQCGIRKIWLAAKLGMDLSRLHAATLRDDGLRAEEIETLLESIHASGREQQNFRFPEKLIKAAA